MVAEMKSPLECLEYKLSENSGEKLKEQWIDKKIRLVKPMNV